MKLLGRNLQIVDEVAARFCVTRGMILGRSRHSVVTRARHTAMFLLRQEGLSYPVIGKLLRRHHTSVMSGIAKQKGSTLNEA